jgi:hypothetical protein
MTEIAIRDWRTPVIALLVATHALSVCDRGRRVAVA